MSALRVSVKVPASRKVSMLPYTRELVPFLLDNRETERVCAEAGCGAPARRIKGYYLVEYRRVRVWVCAEHLELGSPKIILPTPSSIQAGLDADTKHREAVARSLRIDVAPHERVSVKTMASSGHGTAIPFDRVKQFRWEPSPKKSNLKKGKKNATGN